MLTASQALAALAVLSVGVIYGTDIFSAVVLRPPKAALTDPELTQAAGRIHQYGDQRLPLPGAAGTVAAAAAAICADIRAMQKRSDSIIIMRAALQGSAMALLIATLISS